MKKKLSCRKPKRVLRLPDLDHAKTAVLNTLSSPESHWRQVLIHLGCVRLVRNSLQSLGEERLFFCGRNCGGPSVRLGERLGTVFGCMILASAVWAIANLSRKNACGQINWHCC